MSSRLNVKILLLTLLCLAGTSALFAQIPPDAQRKFKVVDGKLQEIKQMVTDSVRHDFILSETERDSLLTIAENYRLMADSLISVSEDIIIEDPNNAFISDSVRSEASQFLTLADSLSFAANETAITYLDPLEVFYDPDELEDSLSMANMSKRQQKRYERELRYSDSTFVRHNAVFRDSIPLSRMSWISVVAPGFSQLYNSQAWKIPILYTTVGTTLTFGIMQNNKYRDYKKQYDGLIWNGETNRDIIDPIQKRMIQHNTYRQLLIGTAALTYIYFLGDGVINYMGEATHVKKATTLSTMFPGAGQFYNKSYWRIPFVWGTMATFAYMIDWNNRGYQRFRLAYDQRTTAAANDEISKDEFTNSSGYSRVSTEALRNYKNSYRRNRDLCIILLSVSYILNIIDAHVDAHMKDYDISDDLNIRLEPTMTNFYSHRSGSMNMMGLSLKVTF